jgi:D-alanyl-lipoteichoic acid acyltransferase DltB (MBOAT superfamily)
MLFNSYEFIFLFLPITFFIYFYLNKKFLTETSKGFLVFASLFFYSWWNINYLPLILISMVFNYFTGKALSRNKNRILLFLGVATNLGLLGYFKYADFMINNINFLFNNNINFLHLLLPLAISFYTFQQIAYLVDSYRNETKEYNFLTYAVFVTFFPQLIAGPIVHHAEMMPQFADKKNTKINYHNIAAGLFIFGMGLFKKVIIADTFAVWATKGFDLSQNLDMIQAWITSLSYTFQLYFDFSGYTDMAIGIALLFNIKLPINFYSPYKAASIQDFWRRWHMTLSRFLKDYIYIPLGGNRKSEIRTYVNLFATFLLGGIWHGAGWTFVVWGAMHGFALMVHRFWQKFNIRMNKILAWFITFNFINFSWVFFRAKDFDDAIKVLKGMFAGTIVLPHPLINKLEFLQKWGVEFGGGWINDIKQEPQIAIWLILGFLITLGFKNSMQLKDTFKPNWLHLIATILFFLSIFMLYRKSEFIYFNF